MPLLPQWPRRLRIAGALLGVVITTLALVLFAMTHYLNANESYGESLSADELARNDQYLRGQESYETSFDRLSSFLVEASNGLAQTFPYLQFRWNREATFNTCSNYHDDAYTGISANRLSDIPIAPADWERAFQIVIDHAVALGPVETGTFHDEDTRHDTLITAGGFSIRFASTKATALSGDTPCRLPQSVLDQNP